LAKKIAQRPNPEELIKEHILEGTYTILLFRASVQRLIVADEDPTKEPKE
jgi:RPEL repeat